MKILWVEDFGQKIAPSTLVEEVFGDLLGTADISEEYDETNVDVGGSVKSKIHMDGVILHPTLYVDGVKRIDRGKILVPIEGK